MFERKNVRARFRDQKPDFDDDEDAPVVVENDINPFIVLLLVGCFTVTFASVILITSNSSKKESERAVFNLVTLRSSEFELGSIWRMVDPFFQKLVFSKGDITVNDWDTKEYGNIRGLVFSESKGLEGLHPVSCHKNNNGKEYCSGGWNRSTVPPLEYIHTMALSILSMKSSSNECIYKENNVLHVGLGAGTLLSFLEYAKPEWKQTALEISHEVIEIAPLFGIHEGDNIHLIEIDANEYFDNTCHGNRFDVISFDAFDYEDNVAQCTNQPEIIKHCLTKDGVVVVNLVFPDMSDENVLPLYQTILVAYDYNESITDEEIFYRTEFLYYNCDLPLLTRGRGFWFDVKSHTDEELLSWMSTIQHSLRACSGLTCLF